jgi:XTP/dITP diphosphohydrolase/tetrapyrrole methylase family protein/MazG family protein
MYAESVWKQMGKKGLAPESGADLGRVAALAAGMDDASLGRMLFEIAAAAQSGGLDPEGSLRRHADALMRHAEGRAQKARATA